MKTLIRIVFIIFITNEINYIGNNNCYKLTKYKNNSKNGNITA